MQNLVQSAIDAANQGNKNKAIDFLKQALNNNPKDIDALLVLAAIVNEPTRKRQVLNRILSLTPTNKDAREMLLELDRAEMSAYRPQPGPAPVPQPTSQPMPQLSTPNLSNKPELKSAPTLQQTVRVTLKDTPPSKPTQVSTARTDKPLVFRPSSVWLVLLYLFTTMFCCVGFLAASQSVTNSLPSFMLALLFGVTAISLGSKIEVSEAGIRTSSLLSTAEIKWSDIVVIRSKSMNKKLELVSNKGKSVNISTQVKGYPLVVEMLRQQRPDLFGEAALSPLRENMSSSKDNQLSPVSNSNSVPTPRITGTKTFRKSFFKQYGLLFLMIPICLVMVWLGFADPELRTPSFISVAFGALIMIVPFFQVNAIKVEPNKLTIQTFFEEKEFSARQIKEIKMQSIRGRYGRVTNFVNIIPLEGKKYPLGGFSDGDEIIYGFLINWWNSYQNK